MPSGNGMVTESSSLRVYIDDCDPSWFQQFISALHDDDANNIHKGDARSQSRGISRESDSTAVTNDRDHKSQRGAPPLPTKTNFGSIRKLCLHRSEHPPLLWTRKDDMDTINAFWWGIVVGMPQLEELELHQYHQWADLGTTMTFLKRHHAVFRNLKTLAIVMGPGSILENSLLEFSIAGFPVLQTVVIDAEMVTHLEHEEAATGSKDGSSDSSQGSEKTVSVANLSLLLECKTLERIVIRSQRKRPERSCRRISERRPELNHSTVIATHLEAQSIEVYRSFFKSAARYTSRASFLRVLDIGEQLAETQIVSLAEAIGGKNHQLGSFRNLHTLAICFQTKPLASDKKSSGVSSIQVDPIIQRLCNALRANVSLLHVRNHSAATQHVGASSYQCIIDLLRHFNFRLRVLDLCRVATVDANSARGFARNLETEKDFFLRLNFWGRDRLLKQADSSEGASNHEEVNLLLSMITSNDISCLYFVLSQNPSLLFACARQQSSRAGDDRLWSFSSMGSTKASDTPVVRPSKRRRKSS